MRKNRMFIWMVCVAVVAVTAMAVWGHPEGTVLKRGNEGPKDTKPKIALAYVEESRKSIPDANMFTHLIYAFAEFNDACDGVEIKHPEKLQAMADLKKQNPDLKVILGVGGYKREGFCEMAGDKKRRKAFVKQIKSLISTYGLDGVDLDWEFPTTTDGGHTASPNDAKNYATVVKDLRKALGKNAWISYYSTNSGDFIDHKKMVPYVSYVNVSGYNLSVPREGKQAFHQSPLYASKKTGEWCVSKAVAKHMDLGIPKEKILMGIPFFGRGKSPFPSYAEGTQYDKYKGNSKIVWDEEAQAPYFADAEGNLLMGIDDERSIAAKFDFIRVNDIPGVFVWHYDADYTDHRLGKAIERERK